MQFYIKTLSAISIIVLVFGFTSYVVTFNKAFNWKLQKYWS